MPRTHLLMMLGSHLLLMMLRAHLLLMMLHLLIHRMRSLSSASVLDCVAGTHPGLVSLSVSHVPVIFFGGVFVPVFSSIHSCPLAVMFGYVPGFIFSFPCSRCSPESFGAFALLVGLIE